MSHVPRLQARVLESVRLPRADFESLGADTSPAPLSRASKMPSAGAKKVTRESLSEQDADSGMGWESRGGYWGSALNQRESKVGGVQEPCMPLTTYVRPGG